MAGGLLALLRNLRCGSKAGCSPVEVLNVKVHVFILLLFALLPDCSQNQTAVSVTLLVLSDF